MSITIAEQGQLNREEVEDTLLDILIMAYVFGNYDANESLGTDISVDIDKMNEALYRKFEDRDFAQRIADYVFTGSVEDIMRVAETEVHRDYNAGAYDTATEGGAKYKRWTAVMDDRTRETHWYLNGTKVGINDYFYTFDGNKAKYPGDFGVAYEDCNCRCIAVYEN